MKLEEIKANKTPFTLPDGYFDSLPQRLSTRLQPSGATKIRSISSSPLMKVLSYAASVVLLFAMGGLIYYNDILSIPPPETYAEEYSNDYFDDFYETLSIDDYTLYNYLASSNTDF